MAVKTVEFVKVKVFDLETAREVEYLELKSLLIDIIDKYATGGKQCKSLDLSPEIQPGDIEPKQVLDIFEVEQHLFCRACRKKPNNAILKRNYETMEPEEVFNSAESLKQGIEVFTFLYLDYQTGVIAIANAKDAPGVSILNKVFSNYRPERGLQFSNIPNEEGINALYGANNPQISKIEFEIPSPNAEFLQRVLGLPEEDIAEMLREDITRAAIVIQADPYQKIEKDPTKVQRIIDILKERKGQFTHTVVRGCSEEFNTQNFDLQAKYFTYPIEVRHFRWVRGEKKEFSLEEITEQFRKGLKDAYDRNYDMVTAIANR